jgi:solute carrier family 25 (mitochondrial carnitine/acylcarnitine transporter), member 20/29
MSDSIIAGSVSGIFQTIVGHPLDTLKTWKQNNILKTPNISFRNLYKGVLYPALQTPIICGLTFGIDNYFYKHYDNKYMAGFTTGIIGSFIISPFEYIKVQKQQQINNKINLVNIIKSYKHLNIVMMREVPALTIYFSTYKLCRESGMNSFISGGLTGITSWTLTYPLDTIKSRVQSGATKSIVDACKIGGLFNGFSYCLVRAVIANGVTFSVYENCLKFLKKN